MHLKFFLFVSIYLFRENKKIYLNPKRIYFLTCLSLKRIITILTIIEFPQRTVGMNDRSNEINWRTNEQVVPSISIIYLYTEWHLICVVFLFLNFQDQNMQYFFLEFTTLLLILVFYLLNLFHTHKTLSYFVRVC